MLTYKMWHVGECQTEIYTTCYGWVTDGWSRFEIREDLGVSPESYSWWGLVLGDWSYGFGIHIWREGHEQ